MSTLNHADTESDYYNGLNQKLLAAIPAESRRVLELGCANGRLGQRFKELHPFVRWHGVDLSADAVAAAGQHLDRATQMNLDEPDLQALGQGYDTIVIGDLLEHLRQPGRLLETLHRISQADATIVCCLPNMGHLSVIERLLVGDISYDSAGLLDETHTRFFTAASAGKMFLDAGWLPHLQDQHRVDAAPTAFLSHLLQAVQTLGVPPDTAKKNFGLYQMVLTCRKWQAPVVTSDKVAPFSVIVPVNKPWQFELNIARSPGLAEVGAQIIPVVGATSAADAYAQGAAQAHHPWRVLAHQDVYFPRGSGHALSAQLSHLEATGRSGAPIGFVGLELQSGRRCKVGMLLDRTRMVNQPASQQAASLDEFAVVLHEKSRLSIDPALGWHLWGTDLCLQVEQVTGHHLGQVLRVPLFHNSLTGVELPEAFEDSARHLLTKYPQHQTISNPCADLTRLPLEPTSTAA